MSAHSPIGASKAERWMNCPGSVSFALRNPELETSSVYAEEGTRAHWVAEAMAKGWTPPPDADAGMVKHGRQYAQHVEMYQTFYPGESLFEAKLAAPNLHKDAYGTVDFIQFSPATRTLIILDYKYGAGEWVNVKNNAQLLYYALLAVRSLGREGSKYEHIILAIHQPRFGKGELQEWTISYAELMAFEATVKAAIERVDQGNVETKAGKWCRWCNAKAVCKTYYNEFTAPTLAASEGIETLTPQTISYLLENRSVIKASVEALENYAKAACQMFGDFQGWTLASKALGRKWTNAAVVASLAPKDKYPFLYKEEIKTPKQVTELAPELAHELAPYIQQSTYQTLVPPETTHG